jgi:hypothetical protein
VGADFLETIDALVKGDPKPFPERARICICLRGASGDRYWAVVLGQNIECGFVPSVPAETDALLLIGEEEAESILRTGSLRGPATDPPIAEVGGDARLLVRFFESYTSFSSWLDVRAGASRSKT